MSHLFIHSIIRVYTHIWSFRESNKGKVVKREAWQLQPSHSWLSPWARALAWPLSHVPLFETHGPWCTRLLCQWDFSGKNTGVGCHFLLQKIFPTQGSNLHVLCLLHWQVGSLPLSYLCGPVCELPHTFKDLHKEAHTRLVDTHNAFRVYLKRYSFSLR